MWDDKYSKCKQAYLTFMISRYWRLLPLFLACNLIAASVIFLAPSLWPGGHEVYHPTWWLRSSLLLYTGQTYLLGPVWSLAKEIEF